MELLCFLSSVSKGFLISIRLKPEKPEYTFLLMTKEKQIAKPKGRQHHKKPAFPVIRVIFTVKNRERALQRKVRSPSRLSLYPPQIGSFQSMRTCSNCDKNWKTQIKNTLLHLKELTKFQQLKRVSLWSRENMTDLMVLPSEREFSVCVSCTHGSNHRKHFPNGMKIKNLLHKEALSTGHKLYTEKLFPKKGSAFAQIQGISLCPRVSCLWTHRQSMCTMWSVVTGLESCDISLNSECTGG